MMSREDIKRLEQKLIAGLILPTIGRDYIRDDFALSGESFDNDKILRKAAVLIPIIKRDFGLSILLTKRTAHLPSHAGQVALPGGKREEFDKDEIETALRETEEEIGLARNYISILGQLNNYKTGTGFDISPVVGFVKAGFSLEPDDNEVASVFEVPLHFMLDKKNHKMNSLIYKGRERHFYAIEYDEHTIWGATAAILVNFCYVLQSFSEMNQS